MGRCSAFSIPAAFWADPKEDKRGRRRIHARSYREVGGSFWTTGLSQFIKKKLLSSALFGSRCKQEIRLLNYNRSPVGTLSVPGPDVLNALLGEASTRPKTGSPNAGLIVCSSTRTAALR